MQNAKDTFYVSLRDRLAVLNAGRVVVLRGSTRPAVVAVENELESRAAEPLDAFLLRWTRHASDCTEPMPLDSAQCEIRYRTRGTAEMAGMDRGRTLAALDAELSSLLLPARAAKQNFSTDPVMAMATNIFWSTPEFGPATLEDGTLWRAVTVTVFAPREAGE